MNTKLNWIKVIFNSIMLSGLLLSCQGTNQVPLQSFAVVPYNVRVNLTDKPNDNLKAVVVNISHVELLLEKSGKQGRVILAKDLGQVDLMALRNGVLLPLDDVSIPDGVSVKQIRLKLFETGHFTIDNDNGICDLQTPSAQHTGIKIMVNSELTISEGNVYSLVVDFDAMKSVVQQGNGGCLLKPVLKLMSVKYLPEELVDEDGTTDQEGSEIAPGTDGNEDDGADDGYDMTDEGDLPPIVDENDLKQYY